jgi:hypothetical protein
MLLTSSDYTILIIILIFIILSSIIIAQSFKHRRLYKYIATATASTDSTSEDDTGVTALNTLLY